MRIFGLTLGTSAKTASDSTVPLWQFTQELSTDNTDAIYACVRGSSRGRHFGKAFLSDCECDGPASVTDLARRLHAGLEGEGMGVALLRYPVPT